MPLHDPAIYLHSITFPGIHPKKSLYISRPAWQKKFMPLSPRPALTSYQSGARSVAAKTAGAVALGAAALAAKTADAQVVAYQPTSGNVVTAGHEVYINFLNGTLPPNFMSVYQVGISVAVFSPGQPRDYVHVSSNQAITSGLKSGPWNVVADLPGGTSVNGQTFTSGLEVLTYKTTSSIWAGVTDGYIGVKFTNSGHSYYGWVELTTTADLTQVTIDAFGYNKTPLGAIKAGEGIPEPASAAALLAAGAAGLALYRQRKNRRRAAAPALAVA